jgi:hypothetical protein
MTLPIFYRSVDAGAPVIVPTTPGELVRLLDACLVNGYGSKAAAGWTIEYTDSANKRVYRPPAGRRQYLYVDDSASIAYASAPTGYVVASGLGTGTTPYSTSTFHRNVLWDIYADDRTFYYFAGGKFMFFGDFYSLLPGDTMNSVIGGPRNTSSTTDDVQPGGGTVTIARGISLVGSSIGVTVGAYSSGASGGVSGGGLVSWAASQWPFPNPPDNAVHASRITLGMSSTGFRGYLRGIWALPHVQSSFSNDQSDPTIISGAGGFAGRTFVVHGRSIACFGPPLVAAFESNAWDFN